MNRCFILLFSFLLFGLLLSAQPKLETVDSLYRFASSHPRDSASLKALNDALVLVYSDNSDTAIYYAKKQYDIARDRGWRNFEATGLIMIGVSLEFAGQLDSASQYYRSAQKISQEIGDTGLQLAAHNSLGRVYSRMGLYRLSIEETLEAVDLVEGAGDQKQIASILNIIGARFTELNRSEQAVSFFKRAMRINESIGDSVQLVNNSNNLGRGYLDLESTDSSMFYYSKSLLLAGKTGNRYQQMIAYSGLAMNYLLLGDPSNAQWAKDSAEALAFKVKDTYSIHHSDYLQGRIYLERGLVREAISYLEEALEWFDSSADETVKIEILTALGRCYEQVNQPVQALKYLNSLNQLKDEIFLKQRDQAMAQVDIYQQQRREKETEVLNQKIALSEQEIAHQTGLRNLFFVIGILFLVLLLVIFNRYFFERKTKRLLAEKNQIIQHEKERGERLLLNILPEDVASELMLTGKSEATHFEQISVLFSDFVGFTSIAAQLSPAELVAEIDVCFKAFDEIMTRHHIEKIKTIGDAYMAAGGLPAPGEDSVKNTVLAALEMQEFIASRSQQLMDQGKPHFQMRVGIHTGPVVAGIVGVKKFQYDIWGDTVNTASRMESHGGVGTVNISHETYLMVKNEPDFRFESRGPLEVKGKGEMDMYFVRRST